MFLFLAILGIVITAAFADAFHTAMYRHNAGQATGYAIFTVLSAALTVLSMFA